MKVATSSFGRIVSSPRAWRISKRGPKNNPSTRLNRSGGEGANSDGTFSDSLTIRLGSRVKGSSRIDHADTRGLRSFADQYKPKKAFVVSNEREARLVGDIRIMPWRDFLSSLWQGEII